MQALSIQKLLLTAPESYANPGLQRICGEMIKHARENVSLLQSCPVRPEPLCIQFYGPPGIGKSHLSHSVAELLVGPYAADTQSSAMYTRQPGSKFWNGYEGQRAICYDDFLNLTDADSAVMSLSELFQLKTRQDFCPEMAAVEKKEHYAAPMLLILLANTDFPTTIANHVVSEEAVLRRRDFLVQVKLKEGYTAEQVKTMDPALLKNMEHLLFTYHNNPKDRQAGYEGSWLEWPAFVKRLQEAFTAHLDRERTIVHDRMRSWAKLASGGDVSKIDIADPFDTFYRLELADRMRQPGWLPSQEIKASVMALSAYLDDTAMFNTSQLETVPKEILTQADTEIAECGLCHQLKEAAVTCADGHITCTDCQSVLDTQACQSCSTGAFSGLREKLTAWLLRFRGRWTDLIHPIWGAILALGAGQLMA